MNDRFYMNDAYAELMVAVPGAAPGLGERSPLLMAGKLFISEIVFERDCYDFGVGFPRVIHRRIPSPELKIRIEGTVGEFYMHLLQRPPALESPKLAQWSESADGVILEEP